MTRVALALTAFGLLLIHAGSQARAGIITVVSDGSTLAVGLESDQNQSPSLATQMRLNTGDTSGLTFVPADVTAAGSFIDIPPTAPANTKIINIPPDDGESGFFKVLFTLPSAFSNPQLNGVGNVDDSGQVFLNGHLITSLGALMENSDTAFATSTASFFQTGSNTLLIADGNYGQGPSAGAFFATITFGTTAVPEPSTLALLAVGAVCCICIGRRKLTRQTAA